MTETTPAEPACQFTQGCHHVVACEPGCAVSSARMHEQLAAATVPASAPTDRAALSARLWAVAEHNIVAEWICCEPINPEHDLCVQGDATRRMVKALLVDDPDAYRPAPLLDAVLADAASGPGGAAGETQQDDAPYPPSVEWRTQTQRRGDHWITWHGVQYQLAEARSDFADTVERDGGRHAWRLIRETTTYDVEAEQPAAVSQPGKEPTPPCRHSPNHCWGCPGGCASCRCHDDGREADRA